MRSQTIALDYDGTLFDIHTPWMREYCRASGQNVGVQDITAWDFPCVPMEWKSRLSQLRTPELYLDADPYPEAVAVVQQLAYQGHRLVCVSHDTRPFAEVKRAQLARFFPSVFGMVLAENKSCVSWDILVDDGPQNRPTFLVPQPWNSPANPRLTWEHRNVIFWSMLSGRFCC